uniref:Fibronectin type-II domain-containing protein n=1 Tax=Leptobrachium leishanense TaxID=445787 RepID=A0A8C5QTZ4_9ANUR
MNPAITEQQITYHISPVLQISCKPGEAESPEDRFGKHCCTRSCASDVYVSVHFCLAASDSASCVFPFLFNGKYHQTCIMEGEVTFYWCSLTSDYGVDLRWSPCEKAGNRESRTET